MKWHPGQVRLAGTGVVVDLRVLDYQFPGVGSSDEGWDSNWLIIAGSVGTTGGRSWSFQHPALTTWEVAEGAAWLRQVAAGAVPAIDVASDPQLAPNGDGGSATGISWLPPDG